MNEKLEEYRKVLTEGLNKKDTTLFNTMFDNVVKEAKNMMENIGHGVDYSSLYKTILPITRRMITGLTTRQLVGFQPMIEEKSALMALERNPKSIQLKRHVIEAESHKLGASWEFVPLTDATDSDGNPLDLEAEILAAISQESSSEIDHRIYRQIRTIADVIEKSGEYDLTAYIIDAVKHIERNAGVSKEDKEGNTNMWMLVSPAVLTYVQASPEYEGYERAEGLRDFVGTLTVKDNDDNEYKLKMYIDVYADDEEYIVVGYKGKSEVDAGLYYCPYTLIFSDGIIITERYNMLMKFHDKSVIYESKDAGRYYVRVPGPPITWLDV